VAGEKKSFLIIYELNLFREIKTVVSMSKLHCFFITRHFRSIIKKNASIRTKEFMKKIFCALSLGLILNISSVFAAGEKVLNVFYDGSDKGQLIVNIVMSNNSTTFMKSNKMLMVSRKVEGCRFGCEVSVKKIDEYSFQIISNKKSVGTFEINDPDSLLPISAFALTVVNGKLRLIFDLETLDAGMY
jgi:hypothetical protein